MRSSMFSADSWLITRTRAGTSARSWASSRAAAGDGLLQPGDGGPEPELDVGGGAALPDLFVELVLQVQVALGQGIAGNPGLLRQGDDGQRAVGALGAAGQDARHRGR